MKAAELCAGYGGLALAIEQVFDAETAWVSEFEDAPSRILAHHWPDAPNHGDMTKIDWAAVEPVDIISGGTPCQDLSHAGKREGMTDGTRSNLWVQMREAIATIKPTYVVWENVRGAYSAEAASDLEYCPGCMGATADRGTVLRALGRVLGDLSDLGYDCQWRGLRAADVGAPHGRFRVFVLATLQDAHLAARGERRQPAPGQAEGGRARAHVGGRDRAHASDTSSDPGWIRNGDDVPAGGGALGYRSASGRSVVTDSYDLVHGEHCGRVESPQASREWIHAGNSGRPSSSHRGSTASEVSWGEYESAIRSWETTLGRRAPTPTEPTGRNGGHRLSARFAEWMMGVPNGWIVDVPGITRNEALKAAGNGVVPQQAIAALSDMLAAQKPTEVAA